VRIRRTGHVAHDRRQVEPEHALIFGVFQRIGPQARRFRVLFDELHLRIVAARQAQIVDRLFVDEEHRGRRAVFGCHVGDRRAVAEREARRASAAKLQIRADYFFLAQEFRQREHDVGGRDARLTLARQLDADDIGQAHPRRAAQHHVLRLQPADADGDHAERIDVRRVAVGADERVGIRDAIDGMNHGRHPLQIDLVHDAVAGRNHVDVLERLLRPVDEVEAVFIAPVFDRAVLRERVGVEAAAFDGQRVIDNQLHGHDGVHLRGVAALIGDRIAQAREIDERRLPQNVMAHDTRRKPRKIELALALDDLLERSGERRRIAASHEIFGVHARRVRQLVVGARLDRVDGGARVEVIQRGAGQRFAVFGIHDVGTHAVVIGSVWR